MCLCSQRLDSIIERNRSDNLHREDRVTPEALAVTVRPTVRIVRSDAIGSLHRSLANPRQQFWQSHARAGFLVLTAESAFIVAFMAASPNISHRFGSLVITSATAMAGLVAVVCLNGVSKHQWRTTFSLSSVLAAGAVLTVCICWSGGLDSPLISLLALPIMSAALGLSGRMVAICGAAGLIEFGLVVWLDSEVHVPVSTIMAEIAFLGGTVALSLGAALYRTRLEADECRIMEELHRRARTDSLTGCLSHGAFYQALDVEIARALRLGEPLGLLVADVDLFKSFNDARGHFAGDQALASIGSDLRRVSRSFDHVGRVGGDEFAAILPHTDLAGAETLAERMVQQVAQGGNGVTISVGVAALDSKAPSSIKLFHDADQWLYRAKARGRGRTASVSCLESGGQGIPTPPEERADAATAQADWDRLEESLRITRRATAEASSIIDSLQAVDGIGFGHVDRDFRLIRINAILAEVNGGRVEDQVGRTVAEVVPLLWPTLEPIYRTVLESGVAVLNQEVSGPTASDAGSIHYWLSSFYPVWVDGVVTGIALVAIDITERKLLEESQAALAKAVVGALSASAELRDPYTAGHQERVARIALVVATELALEPPQVDSIVLAARIHDIGKLSVPSEILARPGRLSDAEMAVVREHCRAGFDLLCRMEFPRDVASMVLQHHERMDGSGYPDGLQGPEIALGSRIIAVADVLESMVTARPYRNARGFDAAVEELQRGSGTTYDAGVVKACLRVIENGKLTFYKGGMVSCPSAERALASEPN